VVGTRGQAVDAVGAGVARGKDDDAQLLPALAQPLDQRQAAAVRQADVDDCQPVAARVEVAIPLRQAGHALGGVAGLFQELSQLGAQHGFVFEEDHFDHGHKGQWYARARRWSPNCQIIVR
jgi:hypothetical protein